MWYAWWLWAHFVAVIVVAVVIAVIAKAEEKTKTDISSSNRSWKEGKLRGKDKNNHKRGRRRAKFTLPMKHRWAGKKKERSRQLTVAGEKKKKMMMKKKKKKKVSVSPSTSACLPPKVLPNSRQVMKKEKMGSHTWGRRASVKTRKLSLRKESTRSTYASISVWLLKTYHFYICGRNMRRNEGWYIC